MGADTKQNHSRGGGALELLEHAILLDAARDDDGGRDTEPLGHGEVNLLDRFCAPELVDLESVTINTGKGEVCGVSAGADRKSNAQGGRRTRARSRRSP